MKITIIGGGAHRVLGILRGALALPGVLDEGEIVLHDLDLVRAEAMGRMLLKTPEQARARCRIRWSVTLEQALEGADVVGVILPAAGERLHLLARGPSLERGYISSDNVSPLGAVCAARIAPTILKIALTMERLCPAAWLVNFVNPTAVLSGLVNNHTRIRALGVCAGFTNHLWDIPRLFGKDEEAPGLRVEAAGINHLSFILKGTWGGEDLFTALAGRLADPGWRPPELQRVWSEPTRRAITNSVNRLARFWRELGVLVFSSEADGMDHLMYAEAVAAAREHDRRWTPGEIDAHVRQQAERRRRADCEFQAWLDRELDADFWETRWTIDGRFKRQDEDIFVRIFAALAGVREAEIVTSRPNDGAITGIKDRHVVEYTQRLSGCELQPTGRHEVPDVVHGLVASLAAHQTLLGDALAADDPRALARALLSYPMNPYSRELSLLYKELFALDPGGFTGAASAVGDYL